MTPTTKTCFKCGVEKPVTDFYRHSAMGDGRLGKCKECTKADVRANYRANVDYYKAYEHKRSMLPHRVHARAEYQKTDAGKRSIARTHAKYIAANPIKHAAHVAVGNALRDGSLTRFPCEVCGARAQAHHDDYSKPLDVRWLCAKHHAEWHRHNTPECPDQAAA